MQQQGRRNPDKGDDPAHFVIDVQRAFADVARAQRHDFVDHAQQALRLLGENHDVAAVVEPDLENQHRHQVPEVNVAEHGHGRAAVRRKVHLRRALRVAKVELQRQRRVEQKGQRREQRQPVSRLYRFHAEDAHQRRQNECARHQTRDVGIQNDQHAPVQRDFVGIHVAFNAAHRYSS